MSMQCYQGPQCNDLMYTGHQCVARWCSGSGIGLVIGDSGCCAFECGDLRQVVHHISSVTKQYNMVPQAHHATRWPRVHSLAASAGVCLRATESETSAAVSAKWLAEDFTLFLQCSPVEFVAFPTAAADAGISTTRTIGLSSAEGTSPGIRQHSAASVPIDNKISLYVSLCTTVPVGPPYCRQSVTFYSGNRNQDHCKFRQRVQYKLSTLAFRSLSGQAPAYLTDDCQLVAESGRRTLRPAERSICVIQRRNNTFGDRSFAVAGPRAWNDLPATLRNADLTMDTFCKHLKTVLFTDS